MRILFDATALQPSQGKYHGAGEYAWTVFSRLIELKKHETISCIYDPKSWIHPDFLKLAGENNVELIPVTTTGNIESLLQSDKYSRFYSALAYRYHDCKFETDFIFTVHGLRDLEMPSDSEEWRYSRNIKKRIRVFIKSKLPNFYKHLQTKRMKSLLSIYSDKTEIITVSKHSMFSMLSFFPFITQRDITVLYPPEKTVTKIESANESEFLNAISVSSKSYYLIISADRWIKNAYRAIRALDELYSENPGFRKKTVIAGMPKKPLRGYKIKNPDQFIKTGYLESWELEALYKHTYAFIYPTLNEGFGYPPVEAMRHGTPVLCSAISSTMEVCGDSVIYFNPFSKDEIKNRLIMIHTDRDIHEKYAILGKQRQHEIAKRQKADLDRLCQIILGRGKNE